MVGMLNGESLVVVNYASLELSWGPSRTPLSAILRTTNGYGDNFEFSKIDSRSEYGIETGGTTSKLDV